jgi:hypothetical protein
MIKASPFGGGAFPVFAFKYSDKGHEGNFIKFVIVKITSSYLKTIEIILEEIWLSH